MIRRTRLFAGGALLAATLLLGACGGLPRAPEVGFAGVEWLGVGEHAGEQHLSLRLALRKPSSIANWYDALNNYIRN